jgi:hypothetical protein
MIRRIKQGTGEEIRDGRRDIHGCCSDCDEVYIVFWSIRHWFTSSRISRDHSRIYLPVDLSDSSQAVYPDRLHHDVM